MHRNVAHHLKRDSPRVPKESKDQKNSTHTLEKPVSSKGARQSPAVASKASLGQLSQAKSALSKQSKVISSKSKGLGEDAESNRLIKDPSTSMSHIQSEFATAQA